MTTDDVLTKIERAGDLDLLNVAGYYFCAVCYRRAYHVIAIYKPLGEVIPLCEAHLDSVEQPLQETLRYKNPVTWSGPQSAALSP